MQFIEFSEWGYNTVTVSFIGTIVFGLIFGWGLYQQIKTIKTRRSGKSIPMAMSIYFTYHFFTFSVYGFRQHSLAMVLNGMFGFLWLGIYLNASNWPDSGGRIRALEYLFFPMPFIMAFIAYPSVFMSVLFITSSFFLLDSPREILRKRNSGSVDPKLLLCFAVSAMFWTVYSACISEWPIFVANIFGILVMFGTLALWAKYRPAPRIVA